VFGYVAAHEAVMDGHHVVGDTSVGVDPFGGLKRRGLVYRVKRATHPCLSRFFFSPSAGALAFAVFLAAIAPSVDLVKRWRPGLCQQSGKQVCDVRCWLLSRP
jgi:hypothetical protein